LRKRVGATWSPPFLLSTLPSPATLPTPYYSYYALIHPTDLPFPPSRVVAIPRELSIDFPKLESKEREREELTIAE